MRREATHAEVQEVNSLLPLITISDENHVTLPREQAERIHHLVRSIHGYRVKTGCSACMLKLVDILRRIAGLGPARRNASDTLQAKRLAICATCPAYHPSTGSCGRLILDAITSHPVEVEGRMIKPCGCVVSLKAMFKSEICPASKWPNR